MVVVVVVVVVVVATTPNYLRQASQNLGKYFEPPIKPAKRRRFAARTVDVAASGPDGRVAAKVTLACCR